MYYYNIKCIKRVYAAFCTLLFHSEGSVHDMCKAIKEMLRDSRQEGRKEGRQEGQDEMAI